MKHIFVMSVALLSTTLWSNVVPDGTFDQSFGLAGVVSISNLGTRSQCFDVVVTPDDSIIVAGSATVGGVNYQALVKLLKDGTLDSTFGENGIVVNTAFSVPVSFSLGRRPEILLYPDGRILVGTSTISSDLVVSRYLKNGLIDTTFGSGLGYVTIDLSVGTLGGIALQKDEKIVVLGNTSFPANGLLFRLNSNGSLDTSFGVNGQVLDILPDLGPLVATSVGIDSSGKIIIGGSLTTLGDNRPFVARFDKNGSLDTTFGISNGYTAFSNPNSSLIKTIIQSDGTILQIGFDSQGAFIIRYSKDGIADATFGEAGISFFSIPGLAVIFTDIAVQVDSKLVVAGITRLSNFNSLLIARFNSDGSLDQSFAQGGSLVTPYVTNGTFLETIAIDSNGALVAGGYNFRIPNEGSPNIAVVKTVVDSLQTSTLSSALWQRYFNQNNN